MISKFSFLTVHFRFIKNALNETVLGWMVSTTPPSALMHTSKNGSNMVTITIFFEPNTAIVSLEGYLIAAEIEIFDHSDRVDKYHMFTRKKNTGKSVISNVWKFSVYYHMFTQKPYQPFSLFLSLSCLLRVEF